MFETASFRDQLTSAISQEASRSGLTEYEIGIVDYLQGLASANENELMRTELRKAAYLQRGVPDALNSAREVLKLAGAYATLENRSLLTRNDVERAYRAKFCQIWPFCK